MCHLKSYGEQKVKENIINIKENTVSFHPVLVL